MYLYYNMYEEVTIISDPEGYDLIDQSQPSFSNKPNEILYVCGDIIDSTSYSLKKEDIIKFKSNNLKNIYNCIFNPKIKLLFGNRDLNKIKCKYLCVLKHTQDAYYINKFNTGNINIRDVKIYEELKTELNKEKPWMIESLKSWYPFWNTGLPSFKVDNWASDKDYKTQPFKTRFDEIFGRDPDIGTISAQNLFDTIPAELNINVDDISSTSDKDDYKAFVILAIFRSMCINCEPSMLNNGVKDIKNIRYTDQVRGWLTSLYKNHNSCKLINYRENLLLLSHGGITKKLIDNPNIFGQMKNDIIDGKIKSYLSDIEEYKKMLGGYYNSQVLTELQDIESSIRIINNSIKTSIYDVLETEMMIKPEPEILFLLIISTPFNCSKFIEKIKNDDILCNNIKSSELYGPIVPGIFNMRNLFFTVKNKIIYQIIGHKPLGFGATIDYFESLEKIPTGSSGVLINLDISNSFNGMIYNKLENNNLSKTMLKISSNGNVSLYSQINIDDKSDKLTIEDYIDTYKYDTNPEKKDKIIKSKSFDLTKTIIIENNIDELKHIIKYTTINNYNTINYHGYTIQKDSTGKNIKYQILTHLLTDAYTKTLLILSNEDFKKFLNRPDIPEFIIGGNINKNYYELYQKYKTKYIKLKNISAKNI